MNRVSNVDSDGGVSAQISLMSYDIVWQREKHGCNPREAEGALVAVFYMLKLLC